MFFEKIRMKRKLDRAKISDTTLATFKSLVDRLRNEGYIIQNGSPNISALKLKTTAFIRRSEFLKTPEKLLRVETLKHLLPEEIYRAYKENRADSNSYTVNIDTKLTYCITNRLASKELYYTISAFSYLYDCIRLNFHKMKTSSLNERDFNRFVSRDNHKSSEPVMVKQYLAFNFSEIEHQIDDLHHEINSAINNFEIAVGLTDP